ncbi:hypothetical protein H7U40_18020 [Flavonifractor plautii]|nr:hypothetical protein [Flavonifractor plautii]
MAAVVVGRSAKMVSVLTLLAAVAVLVDLWHAFTFWTALKSKTEILLLEQEGPVRLRNPRGELLVMEEPDQAAALSGLQYLEGKAAEVLLAASMKHPMR